jgi:hypothetical protein
LTLEQLTFLTNNMATSLSLENDSSLAQGYLKVNGSTAATLTTSGITGNLVGNVTGSLTQGGSLTLGTAQTASGTSVDFTGIPSWAKRVTAMFSGVSTNGTSNWLVQIGTSSGVVATGYASTGSRLGTSSATLATSTAGFIIKSDAAGSTGSGLVTIANVSSNFWCSQHTLGSSGSSDSFAGGGAITLSGALDRVRITTVNGTDTFDAGTINIMFEG